MEGRGLLLLLALTIQSTVNAGCAPHWCSQHGLCSGPGDDAYCFCEYGFSGSDCTRKLCPKGVDPLSPPAFKTITMKTGAAKGELEGDLLISFLSEEIKLSAAAVEPNELQTKLSSMKNIDTVDVSRGEVDKNLGTTYTITFVKWPAIPYENNLFSNNGSPPLSAFSCNTTGVTGEVYSAKCEFKDVVSKGGLYQSCSGHGVCEEQRGKCACEPGWNGAACDDNRDAGNVIEYAAEGPFFAGNIVALQTNRDRSGSFNFLTASTSYGNNPVFTLAGNGNVTMNSGDLSVENGGVAVKGGDGIAIVSQGSSKFPSISGISPGGGAAFYVTGDDFTGEVMKLSTDRKPSTEFDFLTVEAASQRILTISGEGVVELAEARLERSLTAANVAVGAGGIYSDGKVEAAGVLEVKGSAVLKGGVEVNSGIEILDGGLKISAEERTLFTTTPEGTSLTKLEVTSGGLKVASGGVDVGSGGLTVEGGIDLKSGDFSIAGNFEVQGGVKGRAEEGGNALVGKSDDTDFSGALLGLEGVKPNSDDQYLLIEAIVGEEAVFTVGSTGIVDSTGIRTQTDVDVGGHLNVNGGTVFKRHSPTVRNDVVEVKAEENTFVEVNGGGDGVVVKVVGEPKEGQLLIVQNSNNADTLLEKGGGNDGGATVKIPAKTLLMFVFASPTGWTDVTAVAAHSRDLTGVTTLTAVNDLDIGDHTLTASKFISTGGVEGNVAYFDASGSIVGVEGVKFDKGKDSLVVNKLSVTEISGDVDLKGSSIRNAGLIDPKITGVKHLNVDTLGVLTMESKSNIDYVRAAGFDERGRIVAQNDGRWSNEGTLTLKKLGGLKNHLDFAGDISFSEGSTVKNMNMEAETTIKNCTFTGGTVSNTVLQNVTADGLTLGDTVVETLTIKRFDKMVGKLLMGGPGGKVVGSQSVRVVDTDTGDDGRAIDGEMDIFVDVDGNGNGMTGFEWTSGKIGGEAGGVEFVGDIAVSGKLNLGEEGSIKGGAIEGATIDKVKFLGVDGGAQITGDTSVGGELFVEGSLTVSGSVLGSGPYVDASDARFKKSVERLGGEGGGGVMERVMKMNGVYYELDEGTEASKLRGYVGGGGREIGFIAQEVEEAGFGELVKTEKDGFKGVAYSRVTAVCVEGLKEVWGRVGEVEKERDLLKERLTALEGKIEILLGRE
ncbi:hypothetical protein TrLO_g5373 [Triparma laevis f. longispina]|uniref:EGF-like domain-containing protein n=1 Tax=Triparma laevis f. longispina TaxID=1714387 RepID=A0A9W6ZG17_9STRA|nr:hypothetical protein TrLO_g5373 [Triparma laevis f. longispina]